MEGYLKMLEFVQNCVKITPSAILKELKTGAWGSVFLYENEDDEDDCKDLENKHPHQSTSNHHFFSTEMA